MVGNPYRPAVLEEISWRDLQWVEIEQQGAPVWEEVIEDKVTGVVTTLIMPNRAESSKSDEVMGKLESS